MTPLPTPQQLRYLLALAEHRHFGRAAASCAVTQSTLSAGLLALERQLDVDLLDREAGKHVVFTRLGDDMVARARAALAGLEAMAEAATASRAPMSGPLRLGIIPTIAPFLLPRLMPALRQAFPALQPWLREDTTDHLLAQLADGKLDLLLLALPCECGPAESLLVHRDEFLVALPPEHPLAELDRIPATALETERLLLLEEGHCLRDQTLAACGRQRAHPTDHFAATSLHTLVHMVSLNLGLTLLPKLAIDAGITTGTNLTLRPLDGAGAWRSLGLAWRPNSPRTADHRALAPLLAASAGEQAGALPRTPAGGFAPLHPRPGAEPLDLNH